MRKKRKRKKSNRNLKAQERKKVESTIKEKYNRMKKATKWLLIFLTMVISTIINCPLSLKLHHYSLLSKV